jgi:PPOX class probable F420-dependent enzyme
VIPEEVTEFFDGRMLLCYMATVRPDGELSNVPMGIVIHDGSIRISTPADSLKVRNLRHDPHLAVCVPYPDDARRYLLIRGTGDIAEDTDREFIRWIAQTHMGQQDHSHEPSGTGRVVITLVPEKFIFGAAQGVS